MPEYPGFGGMEVVYKIDPHTDEPNALPFPSVCVFTRDAEGPFLDTKTWLNAKELDGINPYGLILVTKVQDMGRAVGMKTAEEYEAVLAELEELRAEADENRAKALAWDALREAREAINA